MMKKSSTKVTFEIVQEDNAIRIKRDLNPSLKTNLQPYLNDEEWQNFCNQVDGKLSKIFSTENARGETMNHRLNLAWLGLVLGAVLIPVVFWKTVGGWIIFALLELLLLALLLWRLEYMKCQNIKRTYEELNKICSQMTMKIKNKKKDTENSSFDSTKNVEFRYAVVQEPILKYRKKTGVVLLRLTPSLQDIANDNYIEIITI